MAKTLLADDSVQIELNHRGMISCLVNSLAVASLILLAALQW